MRSASAASPCCSSHKGLTQRTFSVSRRDAPNVSSSFHFKDDKWTLLDILRPHERDYLATLNFSRLEPWLRDSAKLYVAHLWLSGNCTVQFLQSTLVAVSHLGKVHSRFKGRPIDLGSQQAREFVRELSSREYSPSYYQSMSWYLNGFMRFVRETHPRVRNDFIVVFPESKKRVTYYEPLEKAQKKRVPTDILSAMINACNADLEAFYEKQKDYIDQGGSDEERKAYQRRFYHRRKARIATGIFRERQQPPKMRDFLGRAIKGQALILAICVGRRAEAICNVTTTIRTENVEWVSESGEKERGVLLRFREMKIKNIDEDVFCPDAFGELAVKAINTAHSLTKELREVSPEWKHYLFLIPAKISKVAQVLTPRHLNHYINGQSGQPPGGILQRYKIKSSKVTTHNFRATRATNAWLGGLQPHEVAYDLGHANVDMSLRHYIVGNEESRRRFAEYMQQGAVSGALLEIVGGQEILDTRLCSRHFQIMKTRGFVGNINRYGVCWLPVGSGPCIRTLPCYLGPSETHGGCDFHLLTPDALEALEEDKQVVKDRITTHENDPEFKVWIQHSQLQLRAINRKIQEATILKSRCLPPESTRAES